MPQNKPAAPAVLETLEKLLASETFGRSERARKLLRYLVEQEQAGRADRLKGFAIAVDVFGRDAGFDSSADAVVRVQAGRLRELLGQYFATEGASDLIRITIPRGSYVPAYEIAFDATVKPAPKIPTLDEPIVLAQPQIQADTPPADAGQPPAFIAAAQPLPPASQVMRHLWFFWGAMAVIIAMLGFLVFRITEPATLDDVATLAGTSFTETGSITKSSTIEALPPVYITNASEDADATRVATVLRAGLSGFDTVDFIAKDVPAGASPVNPNQFVFNVSPGTSAGTVAVELQHSGSGKILVSRTLSPADLDPKVLDDRIADILSATIPVSGAIYGFIDQNDTDTGLTRCLLLNDNYYLDQTPQKHEEAYRCFEQLLAENAKSPLIYSELASLHLEAVTDHHPYPPGATAEQALALAHRGVLTGPTSPYTHRSYGFLNSRVGDPTEAIRFMRKAYELNTYDLSMAAAYGYALIFSGNYTDGAPIMEHAVEASSAHPMWWDYGLFLAKLMTGDMERAARATESLAATKKSHYLAARLIAFNVSGKTDQAKAIATELVNDFPKFAADPRPTFEKANYPADLTEKLVNALRAAGLGGSS
ncbi:hypothetical protein [Mesorhizobium sp. DCY119]|uniref:tetratricopeptide repeat protein n=1 Tax=Mesorhizobium sp. DCY119 TaxID=2108445 RepID=UPI0013C435C8|nr:hypothetical protein [Mesorhizobium sp. DCY119]